MLSGRSNEVLELVGLAFAKGADGGVNGVRCSCWVARAGCVLVERYDVAKGSSCVGVGEDVAAREVDAEHFSLALTARGLEGDVGPDASRVPLDLPALAVVAVDGEVVSPNLGLEGLDAGAHGTTRWGR